jgi:hypothetical protein
LWFSHTIKQTKQNKQHTTPNLDLAVATAVKLKTTERAFAVGLLSALDTGLVATGWCRFVVLASSGVELRLLLLSWLLLLLHLLLLLKGLPRNGQTMSSNFG